MVQFYQRQRIILEEDSKRFLLPAEDGTALSQDAAYQMSAVPREELPIFPSNTKVCHRRGLDKD